MRVAQVMASTEMLARRLMIEEGGDSLEVSVPELQMAVCHP